MTLEKNDRQYYYNLSKGYEGELLFDTYLEKVTCDCLILNDLLLSQNNQTFQIDSLLILPNSIHIFEIKNYEGEYYFESNRFFKKDHKEISNPLIQLQRTETLLRQWLTKYNFSIPIQSSVVFINPGFTLYQAPLDKPLILPTQLNQFIKSLNPEQFKLNIQNKNLADKLIDLHILEYPVQVLPTYHYHDLQKGVKCNTCSSFSISSTRYRSDIICSKCHSNEKVESAVIRTIEEFQLLFPEEKITANKMYEWCSLEISQRTLRRILNKYLTKAGANRWIYYS